MSTLHHMLPADIWMRRIFDAKAARDGGVVRRSRRDIDRILGMDRFLHELERRGFHAVQNGDQVVIFCNNQAVRLLC